MPLLAEWTTNETAQGGWIDATARLDRKTYLDHPEIVKEGAEVLSVLRESGDVLFWGTLGTPVDNGGVIDLHIEGPFRLAQHEVGRIFFGDGGTEGFTPEDGETQKRRPPSRPVHAEAQPVAGSIPAGTYRYKRTWVSAEGETRTGPRTEILTLSTQDIDLTFSEAPTWASGQNIYRTSDGGTDYKQVAVLAPSATTFTDDTLDGARGVDAPTGWQSPEINVEVKKDHIVFTIERGATIYDGQRVGIIRSVPRQDLSGLSFSIDKVGDSDAYTLILEEAEDDDSPFVLVDSWLLDDSFPGEVEPDFAGTETSTYRFSVQRDGDVENAQHVRIKVTDIRTFGISPDDDYTCSDGAKEIASRMGVSDRQVRECGIKMLPADFVGGTFADVMDWLCSLTGFCWGIVRVKGELVMFFRPFGRRVWEVLDPEMQRDLRQLERYSKVIVTFERPDGTFKEIEAVADPNPLGYIRTYPEPFVIDRPASDEQAEMVASWLVDEVSSDRRSGTATLSRVYRNGIPYPAKIIRPGDQLYFPAVGLHLNVTQQSKNDVLLNVTFPDDIARFDRFLARQQQKRARRGR